MEDIIESSLMFSFWVKACVATRTNNNDNMEFFIRITFSEYVNRFLYLYNSLITVSYLKQSSERLQIVLYADFGVIGPDALTRTPIWVHRMPNQFYQPTYDYESL
jgi:hypothetical protein